MVAVQQNFGESIEYAKTLLSSPPTGGAWCQRALDLSNLLVQGEWDDALALAATLYSGSDKPEEGREVIGLLPGQELYMGDDESEAAKDK